MKVYLKTLAPIQYILHNQPKMHLKKIIIMMDNKNLYTKDQNQKDQ